MLLSSSKGHSVKRLYEHRKKDVEVTEYRTAQHVPLQAKNEQSVRDEQFAIFENHIVCRNF